MASQLYPRYVPVKKKAHGLKAASSDKTTTSTSQPPGPTTKPDASATYYARYIPSSKAQAQPKNPTDDVISNPPVTSKKRKHDVNGEGSITQQLAKKSRTQRSTKQIRESLVRESPPGKDGNASHPALDELGGKRKKKRSSNAVVQDGASKLGLDGGGARLENMRHKKILSKREKSLDKAGRLAQTAAEEADNRDGGAGFGTEEQAIETHPLEPLPQPEQVLELEGKPTFSALPAWLTSPVRVSSATSLSFAKLGIPQETINILHSKGFHHAFPIQSSVLPFLLSENEERGDILVSAATGSGKTLAYVLPMVESISHFTITRLRGLIVMPTRELVAQARDVCEICATAYASSSRMRVKIGVAIGSQLLTSEQLAIMNEEQIYDPEDFHRRGRLANTKWESSSQESDGDYPNFSEEKQSQSLPNHTLKYSSKVDILICTPGRLVEHLKSTPGFNLDFINWLVVDEADKLLDQSFQQWLDVFMPGLGCKAITSRPQRAGRVGLPSVTKVILSATVPRDLGQLNALKLHRPRLVILEGLKSPNGEGEPQISEATYNLPSTLFESAIKVDDEGIKPLYLFELMKSHQMVERAALASLQPSTVGGPDSSNGASSSSSDTDSSTGEIQSSSSVASNSNSGINESRRSTNSRFHEAKGKSRGVLIFTKSNESAVRLSRLLSLMDPFITSQIGTLTSTIRSSLRKTTLRSFQHGKLSILVASDLVSRGLDIPHLAHVINYDIPSSLKSYIHRVGRTARAEKEGHAWTLYSKTEARWFWNEIARSALVVRFPGRKVKRARLGEGGFGEDERQRYEAALTALGKEATETRRADRGMKE